MYAFLLMFLLYIGRFVALNMYSAVYLLLYVKKRLLQPLRVYFNDSAMTYSCWQVGWICSGFKSEVNEVAIVAISRFASHGFYEVFATRSRHSRLSSGTYIDGQYCTHIELNSIKDLDFFLFIMALVSRLSWLLMKAWGVRNITLLDYGRVALSNPLRQSLFTHEDSLNNGKLKAEAAAENLKRIFPGVVVDLTFSLSFLRSHGHYEQTSTLNFFYPNNRLSCQGVAITKEHFIQGFWRVTNFWTSFSIVCESYLDFALMRIYCQLLLRAQLETFFTSIFCYPQNATGVRMSIPMPGHPVSSNEVAGVLDDIKRMKELVDEHDVIFLLTDTRESRWLPTLLCADANKVHI